MATPRPRRSNPSGTRRSNPSGARRSSTAGATRDELLPALATVVLAGPAIGLGGQIALTRAFDGWPALWLAGFVWAIGAVVVGAAMPSPTSAAAGGAISALLASASHHLGGEWFADLAVDQTLLERGMMAAAAVGPVLGLGGYWLVHRNDRSRPLAVAVVATAVLAGALAVVEATSGSTG